jgi:hypothetical protein
MLRAILNGLSNVRSGHIVGLLSLALGTPHKTSSLGGRISSIASVPRSSSRVSS